MVEIRLWQIEEPLFLELAHESGRTRPVIGVPTLITTLRVMQQGEQVRDQRRDTQLLRQITPMEGHPCPVARTMNALPVESKRLPYPADQAGGQTRWFVGGQARRTAWAL